MKKFQKLVAIVCSLSLLVGMVPAVVFADTETVAVKAEETPISDTLDLSSLTAEDILGEDESRREANVKHFKLIDGSMVAVSYPVAVHEEVNGEWEEIDNSLTSKIDVEGDVVQATAAQNVRFSFVNGKGNHRLMKVEDTRSDARVVFELVDANKKELILSEATDSEELFAVSGVVQKGTFTNILPDTDIEYIVAGTGLKENIVVKNADVVRELSFILHCKNVTASLKEDNSVVFTNTDGETVFTIPAPFMIDAARVTSDAVAVTLEPHQKGYLYTMTPDTAWTSDPSRVYPVTIDPVVESEDHAIADYDAVWQKSNSTLAFPDAYLPVGQWTAQAEVGALIRIALPNAITETSMIQKAILRVHCIGSMGTVTGQTQINAYQYGASWDNTQRAVVQTTEPEIVGDTLDYAMLDASSSEQYIAFDITAAAKRWTSSHENNGVLLRSVLSSDRYVFSSCKNDAAPSALFQYRDVRGIEDYWTYTTLSSGESGVVGVNNYTGNALYVQPLMLGENSENPIPLTLTYSSNYTTSGWYANMGIGFSTEYHMTVVEEEDPILAQTHPYYLLDGDGTLHYFTEDSSQSDARVYVDEDNLGYSLVLDSDTEDNVEYILNNTDGYAMKFDDLGHLLSIETEDGETVLTVSSQVTSMGYIINGITYGDATATLSYDRHNNRNRLMSITIGNEVYRFTYNDRDYLTKIQYPNGEEISLYYTFKISDTPYLTDISAGDVLTHIGYTGLMNDGRRFVRTSELIANEVGQTQTEYAFAYGDQSTTVEDHTGRQVVYQFDRHGRTVGITDPITKRAMYAEYGVAGEVSANGTPLTNTLLSLSNTMQSVCNYARDASMTSSDVWDIVKTSEAQTCQVVFDSQNGRSDSTSVHVVQIAGNPEDVWVQSDVYELTSGWFTASAYVSTNGETLTGDGAVLRVQILDESQTVLRTLYSQGVKQTAPNGWDCLLMSFELGENESVRLAIGTQGGVGSFWTDDVSLIQGEVVREFNLLENAAFEYGTDAWDTTMQVQDSVLRLDSTPYTSARAQQTIGLQALRGNQISFGAWVKAASVSTDPLTDDAAKIGQPAFSLELRFLDANGATIPTATVTLPCNVGVTDWQFVCGGADVPQDAEKAVLCMAYDYNLGTAYVDDAFVYMNGFKQYDLEEETGSESEEISIDYTQNHQWYSSFPTEKTIGGQSYEAYTTQIVEGTPAQTLSMNETYYILNAETGDALYAPMQTVGASVVLQPLNVKDEGFRWTLRDGAGTHFCRVDENTTLVMAVDNSLNIVLNSFSTSRQNAMSTLSLGDGSFAIATGYSYGQQYLDIRESAGTADTYSATVIQQARDAEAVSQQWLFIPCDYNAYMETQTVYDANGNVLQEVDENGGVTTYTYANGQLASVTDASGNVTTYSYDQDGNMTKMQNGDHVVSYVYENGELVSISKDNVSLQTGGEVEYALNTDAFGRPAGVVVGNAESSQSLVSYLFNDRELIQTITYGNDDTVRYLYNSLDSLTELRYTEDERAFAFAYYDSGETALRKDYVSNRRTRLNYDENGNVSSVLVTSDASSDGGNVLLSKTYSSSEENEVVSFAVGGTSFDSCYARR